MLQRRNFLQQSAAVAAALALRGASTAHGATEQQAAASRYTFCAFTKYMQSLGFDELAAALAGSGFAGIEAPVRAGGYFSMEEAPDKLPQLAAALRKRDLDITILCTDVLRADQPHAEKCLRAAKDLGIKHYRMGFYKYDLKKPVRPQLAEIRPAMKDLAALNKEIGIQALYQNHSGPEMVGATVWDIFGTIEDLDPKQVAMAFDIRHCTIEAGLAWPAVFNAIQGHIGAVFVKDFDWKGAKAEHVPLGKGRVDPKFFAMLADSDFSGPISVHVEYLGKGDALENAAAIKRDYETLKGWLPR
jgi:sugar phosphate isomerase/epimerase